MKYAVYLNSTNSIKRFCRDRLCNMVWEHCNCNFPYERVGDDSPLRVILSCRLMKKVFGFDFESLPDIEKASFMLDKDIGIQHYSFGQGLFLWGSVQFTYTQTRTDISLDEVREYGIKFIPSDHDTIIEIESDKDCSKILDRVVNQGGISCYKEIVEEKKIA